MGMAMAAETVTETASSPPERQARSLVEGLPRSVVHELSTCHKLATPGISTSTLASRPREKGPVSRAFLGGRSWDRTSDLPRVKRALSR
jgi:hypothetical protein